MGIKIYDELKLDWLSFTYKVNPEELIDGYCEFDMFLMEFPKIKENLQDSIILERSNGGFYDHVLKISKNIVISYSDTDKSGFGQGVNVSIPGSGLAILYDWFDLPDKKNGLEDLFRYLREKNCQLSRIDICFDDYDKMITPNQYGFWKMNKEMVSKFTRFKFISSENDKGSTFYLGSRKTGKLLRIYDKDYESKGQVPSIRYEFELHKEYAREFMDFILGGNEFRFENYLLSWFDVKDLSKDKNRSRAPRNKLFSTFLEKVRYFSDRCNEDEAVAIAIPHEYKTPTFDSKIDWVCNTAMRNNKLMIEAYGIEHFLEVLDGVELSDYDYYLLENHFQTLRQKE